VSKSGVEIRYARRKPLRSFFSFFLPFSDAGIDIRQEGEGEKKKTAKPIHQEADRE
jgi:hypothetical protein